MSRTDLRAVIYWVEYSTLTVKTELQ